MSIEKSNLNEELKKQLDRQTLGLRNRRQKKMVYCVGGHNELYNEQEKNQEREREREQATSGNLQKQDHAKQTEINNPVEPQKQNKQNDAISRQPDEVPEHASLLDRLLNNLLTHFSSDDRSLIKKSIKLASGLSSLKIPGLAMGRFRS